MRDITDILREWPYEPDSCVRKVVAADGREVLQVRTALGIEQYELTGRPDGVRPYDCASVLEHVEAQISRQVDATGSGDGFEIDAAAAGELQQEGLIYYYRYLICFQIGEYEIVARDTVRDLEMFDVLKAHCRDEDAANASEQYRPYVVRMNAAAGALMAVGNAEYARARSIIREAIQAITEGPDVPTETFEYEKERSLAILRGMHRTLPDTEPPSHEALLRQELRQAILGEDYERAAELRDQLRAFVAERQQSAHFGRE